MRLSSTSVSLLCLVLSISFTFVSAQDEIHQSDVRIAYITFDDELYISDIDGSNQVKVSNTDQWLGRKHTQWSPDGKVLAYSSSICGDGLPLCIVDETGENIQMLVDKKPSSLQWSPDSQWIAFSTRPLHENGKVYIIRRDGTELQTIVDCSECTSSVVSWSPDGDKLAIHSSRKNDTSHRSISNIYVINKDGSNLRQVSFCEDYCGDYKNVTWSPDSSQLVFTTYEIKAGLQTYLFDINNGNSQVILNNYDSPILWSAESSLIGVMRSHGFYTVDKDGCSIYFKNINWVGYDPVISPNGSQILYAFFQIYVKNVDGSGEQQLTSIEHPTSSAAIDPAWSSDGKQIAFRSAHEGRLALYVMNSDGSNISQIANRVNWFAWQPVINDEY